MRFLLGSCSVLVRICSVLLGSGRFLLGSGGFMLYQVRFDIPKKAPRKQTPFKNKVSKHSNAKYSQPLSKFYRPGFINKGNTCYMNALLQALSVLTGFWFTLPALASEEHHISPLVAAYCQIMFFFLNHQRIQLIHLVF